MEPTPIELLKQRLAKYKRALEQSNIGYLKGEIRLKDNMNHIKNLTPLIREYESAIEIVTRVKIIKSELKE